MLNAAPWRKKSATNSAYSALRTVLSTQTERTDGRGIQALMDGVAVGRREFEEERVSAVRVGRRHPKSRASTLVDIVRADGQRDNRTRRGGVSWRAVSISTKRPSLTSCMACLNSSGIQESSLSTTNLVTCARSAGGKCL